MHVHRGVSWGRAVEACDGRFLATLLTGPLTSFSSSALEASLAVITDECYGQISPESRHCFPLVPCDSCCLCTPGSSSSGSSLEMQILKPQSRTVESDSTFSPDPRKFPCAQSERPCSLVVKPPASLKGPAHSPCLIQKDRLSEGSPCGERSSYHLNLDRWSSHTWADLMRAARQNVWHWDWPSPCLSLFLAVVLSSFWKG